MALILPPWYFSDETDNIVALTTATQFTIGASSAEGTAVRLLPASGGLTHDVHYLVLQLHSNAAGAGTNPIVLVDVMLDPAGGTSFVAFIDDLLVMSNKAITEGFSYSFGYGFPVFIQAGNSIGIRGTTPHTSTKVMNCRCWAFGNPSRPELWWCGSGVETLGIQASPAKGTTVTPGTSGSYGSWTSVGSATTKQYGHIQVGYGGEDSTAMQAQGNYLQIGYGSNKLPGSVRHFLCGGASEEGYMGFCGLPVWCDVPVGTQMQAQIASSLAASPDSLEIAIYGVY